jgi:thioredoxin reductase (NADPH)
MSRSINTIGRPGERERINDGKRTIPTILDQDTWCVTPDNATLRDALGLEQESSTKRYDAVDIGAGATRLPAVIYLQRVRRDTAVLERKNVGDNAFLTSKIENYPGFNDISGPDLMDRMAEQATTYGALIKEKTEVRRLERRDGYFRVTTDLAEYDGRAIIVSTGSQCRLLNIPGKEVLIGQGVHFCATCDAPFNKGCSILAIGGGNSAVDKGIYLADFVDRVAFVARGREFYADSTYTEKLETIDNVTTLMNRTSIEFVANADDSFRALRTRDDETGEDEDIAADGAFIFIGLKPNTSFLSGTIEDDEDGFVDVVPGSVETSGRGSSPPATAGRKRFFRSPRRPVRIRQTASPPSRPQDVMLPSRRSAVVGRPTYRRSRTATPMRTSEA